MFIASTHCQMPHSLTAKEKKEEEKEEKEEKRMRRRTDYFFRGSKVREEVDRKKEVDRKNRTESENREAKT